MKKTTLLLIGALAFVLQGATAQTTLYSDDFEGQTLGSPPHTGSPPYGAMWVYMMDGTVTAWDVENVLDSTYANTTQAAVLDWTNNGDFPGLFLFVIGGEGQNSLAAGGGSLHDLVFSFDVYTEGAAAAGATTPLTIWFDQFPGGVKTFDASISPTITTDGKWNHVSFTLDQLTPSGTSGAYDPTLGFEIGLDGGVGPWDLTLGYDGEIVLDNLLLTVGIPTFIPTLSITQSNNSVVVSWSAAGGHFLQQNSNLAATGWTPSSYPISTSNGTNSITITAPSGNLFFRVAVF